MAERLNPGGPRPDWRFRVVNNADAAAPSQGLIEIYGLEDAGAQILSGRKPTLTGSTRFGVAPREIAAAGVGPVQMTGQAIVNLTLAAGESVAAGDRIGVKKNSWTAWLDPLGTMQVEGVLGVATNAGGTDIETTALARLDRRRGDHQYVEAGAIVGPYQVIKFGTGYTITEPNPGEITVTKD